MIAASFPLFFLNGLPFSRFDFPRWQAALGITAIGLAGGWLTCTLPGWNTPAVLMGLMLSGAVISTWLGFLVIVGILRWWMQRGGRWEGQGELFNLVAASWLVADLLSTGLAALDTSAFLMLPFWLYSLWVGANALAGAIPSASLSYCMSGIILALVPALLAAVAVYVALGFVLVMMGIAPPLPAGMGLAQ